MRKGFGRLTVVALLTCCEMAFLPRASNATGCNAGGCWAGVVELVRIDPSGRIWFVVDNSSQLTNLVPSDNCVLKSIWTGQAEPALYVRVDDPDRDQKYTMLLLAFSSGARVGFAPIRDPATGWCSVRNLDVS